MYRHSNARTHGTIENCERIDSFEAMRCDPEGCDSVISAGEMIYLDCDHVVDYKGEEEIKETVYLSYPSSKWGQKIRLTRIDSGFGGTRAYWLCPTCGERFRYLYFKGRRFICRKCAELNYKCQQEAKNSNSHIRKGLKVAEKYLDLDPSVSILPVHFAGMTPKRPKGMHWSTYMKHLSRVRKYQEQYEEELTRELVRGIQHLRKFV